MSPNTRTLLLQLSLFVLTLITTTLAGAEWMFGNSFVLVEKALGWDEFWQGLHFSIPFLFILTVHEFGHYFTAKAHQVEVTLPYYIPLWFGISQSIGTMGAFIRIKSLVRSRLKFFDIGIAGPLAGFVAALGVLWYGFTHLPPPEYIFSIHPEYQQYGLNYPEFVYQNQEGALILGDSLLFYWFKMYVADPALLPHANEIIHYPYILAGYIALFFTSLNLIPIGQLDGGHILYGLIGKKKFDIAAPALFILFAFYSGLGLFRAEEFAIPDESEFYSLLGYLAFYIYFLYVCLRKISDNPRNAWIIALSIVVLQFGVSYIYPTWEGYPGFLPFIFLLGRFLGVYHPETIENEPLSKGRILLGWLAVLVFILCFSPKPFIIIV
ncbi:site-2 protease family protein [Arundinibacter roseus]|uniref:Site-2 protease family protein n=1 Tax=Arundinibacter roseus TaxID=2070510 RepID=A0A4V2XA99_9BACT|nr:site-2 protease family protein [Arundinibacter roseus]TDB66765.1 site-2 protease family protein [Arundinibacter roseus]